VAAVGLLVTGIKYVGIFPRISLSEGPRSGPPGTTGSECQLDSFVPMYGTKSQQHAIVWSDLLLSSHAYHIHVQVVQLRPRVFRTF
jgi:hypothetical protein